MLPHFRPVVALVGLYAAGLALVGLWPQTVDDDLDVAGLAPFRRLTETLGLTVYQGYDVVEFTANVLLFVPLGAFLMLMMRTASLWHALIAGAVVSALIELLQHLLRPDRVASWPDVVANTIGAGLGAGVVLVARRRAGA